ncbi:MAG TPA: DUF1553 domain-containing protein [Planctomycetes bacterium]|nr:DUF1553 domain-containing protein [Planctomycetota bacterium]
MSFPPTKKCAWLLAVCLASATVQVEAATTDEEVRYGRDIRTLLSDRCFECHGSDSAARESGLRLDQRAEATADLGGYAAIVSGDVDASELWLRINSTDPEEQMPPPSAKKRPFTQEDRARIARWIETGATYEEHWAFVAPVRPELPGLSREDWPRGGIDAFILARLEALGIAPAPEAERATLLRRVYFDLSGLPPTVEELDAFLADTDPEAYERAVERLFTEEPFASRLAEHFATPWLDASRYADTCGIHMDNGRQAWHWRDWVLDALRNNMPYDQFIREQLAGDLIENATKAQQVATGFHRNQVTTDEGGAIDDEYLVEYAIDRVTTTGAVLLGLTVGCARCHDHKYDPVSMDDFYSLVSFFNSVEQPGLYSQTPDSNRAYEPFIEVPSEEQTTQLAELEAHLAALREAMDAPLPGEEGARAEFSSEVTGASGVDWSIPRILRAESSDERVTLTAQPDGIIVAEGPQPAAEDYIFVLETEAASSRLLLLEALSLSEEHPGAGRASHGNAVVNHATLEVRPLHSKEEFQSVALSWAWTEHTQAGGDFSACCLLEDDSRGWTVDGNANAGPRTLLLLADESFGHPEGSEVRVVLSFRSIYSTHSLGRLRWRISPLASAKHLPVAYGRWYSLDAFPPEVAGDRTSIYETLHGPESVTRIDLEQTFGPDERRWTFEDRLRDEVVVSLAPEISAIFLGRMLYAPEARELELSLGSDDGLIVYLNGKQVFERRVDRGALPDQDRLTLALQEGANSLVLRVVNTGGLSGYYLKALPHEQVLKGVMPLLVLPEEALPAAQNDSLTREWRRGFFDGYRVLDDDLQAKQALTVEITANIPRAMVMKELNEPRQTFVLMRGNYETPDESRPVGRATPGFLLPMPASAPQNRLGFAQWLALPEHPLFARVAVNRLWQTIFGRGIVTTLQDFGLQGAWPTHPELLDYLAVEFLESGFDVQGLLHRIVLSSTYRQSSRMRPELTEIDPDNLLLARYPRRRLSAEQIRDQALYTSGLLIEEFGGASVKPYQPPGLWQEVSMLASNTRIFERGGTGDLWRRSLYTYWKRAVPPPALQTLDAPTRESCVVARQITNTPLQALVLWNDDQFVEAALALASRTLAHSEDRGERLVWIMRTATGRAPLTDELTLLGDALASFLERYLADSEGALALTSVGEFEAPEGTDTAQLAAWTLLASSVMNLHETLTQD